MKSLNTARKLPLEGADHSAVMGQLKDIASASYTSLLVADAPPHPDYRLLDMCADAMHAAKQAAEARRAYDESLVFCVTDFREWERWDDIVTKAARAAAKLKATTPAGIYAKALIVRMSATGAAVLAMSLAVDLVDCEGLRESLWPSAAARAGC